MKKRILVDLLAFCLLISLPVTAFAENSLENRVETSYIDPLSTNNGEALNESLPMITCPLTEGCTLDVGHKGDCVLLSSDDGRGTNGSAYQGDESAVAVIDNTPYTSLQDAIDAVAQNLSTPTTIKIVNDMMVTKQINIDKRSIELVADEPHLISFAMTAEGSDCFKVSGTGVGFFTINSENLTVDRKSTRLNSSH